MGAAGKGRSPEEKGDLSDEQLLHRVRQGDEDAFCALCERYSGLLQARIRSRLTPALRRKVGASDILQESYVTALQRIATFEHGGDGSFGRWLAKIVEHKIRDAVRWYVRTAKRGLGREVSHGDRPDTVDLPGSTPSPSQVAMADELKGLAHAALAELPPDYREVVRLIQEQQHSFAEAAVRMGRSKAAVKRLYERALARFAQLLETKRGETR
ncbi:MAG: sigma-70 family RNA polymerase sigma factor [Planctomycetota bacterium]|jgi:RNA polymerase sigma-70 factor (ECF subfamily)